MVFSRQGDTLTRGRSLVRVWGAAVGGGWGAGVRERDRGGRGFLRQRGIQKGGDNDGLEPGVGVKPVGLLEGESNGGEVGVGGGVGSGSRADSVLVWEGVGDPEEAKRDLGGMMLECTWIQ